MVPAFALALHTKVFVPVHSFDLTRMMHEKGINVRMLGYVSFISFFDLFLYVL